MERDQAFFKAELEPTSFWSKIRGHKPEKNAVIEINNLLSEKPVLEVRPEDIQAILDKYSLNLYRDFDDGSLRELYKTYLRYCFDDNHLDEHEIIRLKHLKRLLGLSDKAVEIANHQVCYEVYERELEVALEDHRLDEKEIQFLHHLQNKLKLPQELADTIYQNKAQGIIINFIKGAIADERLSPDEETELQALIDNLGVQPQIDESTQADLAKYRLLWQMENGEIHAIHVPLKLKPDESCYFLADATWYLDKGSLRKREESIFHLKTKLIKGNYWKVEEGEALNLSAPTWKLVSEGKVYITNERIIFRSRKSEEGIRLTDIINYYNYSNGIYLCKDNKKNLFIHVPNNRDVFSMILGRVLRDL